MADYLIEFIEGQTIRASEHNSNNQYLLDQLNDSIKTLNAKVSSLQSNIQTQLQAQLDQIFPIGCIHLSLGGAPAYGQWVQVAQDRVIQGSGSLWGAGANVPQGLPDIGGDTQTLAPEGYSGGSGALYTQLINTEAVSGSHYWRKANLSFLASRSNATYTQPQGRVQPYAYVVNVWQRVA